MSKMNDGGPAFPARGHLRIGPGESYTEFMDASGMTLRDYFAAAALSGLVPNAAWDYSSGPCNEGAAARCYAIADAMLAERERER